MSTKIENKTMVVRLVTGELLMGRMTITPTNETTAMLKDVMMLHELPPSREGQQGNLAMVPFMPFTDGTTELEVFLSNVVYMTTPVQQIADKYREAFSPIVKPTAGDMSALMDTPIGDLVNKD